MHTEVPIFYKVSENFVFRKKIPNKQDTPPTFQVYYYVQPMNLAESRILHIIVATIIYCKYLILENISFVIRTFLLALECAPTNHPI